MHSPAPLQILEAPLGVDPVIVFFHVFNKLVDRNPPNLGRDRHPRAMSPVQQPHRLRLFLGLAAFPKGQAVAGILDPVGFAV